MQPQPQNRRPQSDLGPQLIGELIEGIGRSICLTLEVFTRRGFGSRYVGCGFMGVVVIFLFSLFFPGQDIRVLLGFAVLYVIFWLIAFVNAGIRRWRRLEKMHSLYNGRPHIWRFLPNWKEKNVKHVEALAAILFGFGVHLLNRPLGDFLMIAAIFVFLRGYNDGIRVRDRAIRMSDALIEQKVVAEQFREIRGE
jgi:hypothetical protein